MRSWLLILFAILCSAEPTIRVELRSGILRADVRHGVTDNAVTAEDPAEPDEGLVLNVSDINPESTLLISGQPVAFTIIGEERIAFTMPRWAGGGYIDIGFSGGIHATFPARAAADDTQLRADEVRSIITSAAMAVDDAHMAVVVTDRAGRPLGIFRRLRSSDDDVEQALSLARTGAFFSNQNTPLSSRTVRAISRANFPEGIPNQPAGALFGIENTNRGCNLNVAFNLNKDVPRSLNATGTGFSRGIATVPGGLPLFRDGVTVIGGLGVAGVRDSSVAEFAAVAATSGTSFFVKLPLPPPAAVYLDGFQLPFVVQTTPPDGTSGATMLGGVFQLVPLNGNPAPDEWLVGPTGSATMTADEVRTTIENAIERANRTRAAIRLPLGTRTRMVIAVSDLDGNILGLYRMPDSTIFSIDVAATKARNVVYFSGPLAAVEDLAGVPLGTAITNRTIGFGSQPFFPSGILNSTPGPFRPLFDLDVARPCTQGHQPPNPNQSGIVFFPGSAPLYRNGQLVGGLGVSGDGVEQDDYVTAGGAQGFEPPPEIRADQVFLRGVRLPYWKFPRNPEQ